MVARRMLKIGRKANGDVILTLSGQIDREHIAELEQLIAAEGKDAASFLTSKS
jgi:hypothetical protein